MQDLLSGLWAQMAAHGFSVSPESVNLNGEFSRFPRDSGSGLNGWVKVQCAPELAYAQATYGDWKTGEKFFWQSSDQGKISEEQEAKIREYLAARKKEAEAKRQGDYEHAKQKAATYAERLSETGRSPYFERKGLKEGQLFNCLVGEGNTYVPAFQFAENSGFEVWGFQKISAGGEKQFQPGMKIKGGFCAIPPSSGYQPSPERIFFCEGIATAATIWQAFAGRELVISCFNAGNLAPVVEAWRLRHPAAQFVICGDDDVLTTRLIRGKRVYWNPGREFTLAAAEKASGPDGSGPLRVVYPDFHAYFTPVSFQAARPSDFNDLRCPPEEIAASIENQIATGVPVLEPRHLRPALPGPGAEDHGGEMPEQEDPGAGGQAPRGEYQPGDEKGVPGLPDRRGDEGEGPGAGDYLTPIPWREGKDGKPKPPGQQAVADALIEHYGRNLIRCDHDIFQYTGSHWEMCGPREERLFFCQIRDLFGPSAKSGEIEAALNIFRKSLPSVPAGVSLYDPRSDRANFQNGTLHLNFRKKSVEELEKAPGDSPYVFSMLFKPHAREDWCTTVIPLDYKPLDELQINQQFEDMLSRIWPKEDPDQADKIWLYKELLGASLLPMFPKIFFFVGVPQSGKSTLLAIMSRLLSEENVSSVDPTKWGKEFHLEPMLNKLANIHSDISTQRTIDDSIMKTMIDRMPVSVNRKGIKMARARLPGLHAFGCNDLPKSLEGASGAYDRRAIVIRTTTVQPGHGGGGDFSAWVYEMGPEGILRAALEGLTRLLANGGAFTVPASSREEIKDWAEECDAIALFADACEAGQVFMAGGNQTIVVKEGASITSEELWKSFISWREETETSDITGNHIEFSRKVSRLKRFERARDMKRRYWKGIGIEDRQGAAF